jgi:alkylation response protein AidB-like acyl-CoA dehydrogenase
MVELVRDFVSREVGPVLRASSTRNTYPDKLIEQMKQLGIYGLAIPSRGRRLRSARPATRGSPRNCPAAG